MTASPRVSWATAALLILGLVFLYVLGATTYVAYCPAIAKIDDFWFGSDIPRHVTWMSHGSVWERAHWHPASAGLFKAYGALLRLAGYEQPSLLAAGVPVAVFTATSIVTAAFLVGAGIGVLRATALLVAVGPTLLFSALPESHMLGGSALLLQTALILNSLRLVDRGELQRSKLTFAASHAFGCLAAGFTLTNVLPAAAVAFGGTRCSRHHRSVSVWTIAFCVSVGLVFIQTLTQLGFIEAPWTYRMIEQERQWTHSMSAGGLIESVQSLFVSQFGVPPSELVYWRPSPGADPLPSVVVAPAPSLLAPAAAVLWIVGIACIYRDASSSERAFMLATSGALILVILEHVVIARDEAFIFAPHAWTYVVAPFFVTERPDMSRAARGSTYAIIGMSGVQSVMGVQRILVVLSSV